MIVLSITLFLKSAISITELGAVITNFHKDFHSIFGIPTTAPPPEPQAALPPEPQTTIQPKPQTTIQPKPQTTIQPQASLGGPGCIPLPTQLTSYGRSEYFTPMDVGRKYVFRISLLLKRYGKILLTGARAHSFTLRVLSVEGEPIIRITPSSAYFNISASLLGSKNSPIKRCLC